MLLHLTAKLPLTSIYLVPSVDFDKDIDALPVSEYPSSPAIPSFHTQNRLGRFLRDISVRPNDSPHDLSDPSVQGTQRALAMSALAQPSSTSPEADSFSYIETVLESLAVLGKLGASLDLIVQRLPGEIFSLVENTLEEVSERSEFGRRSSVGSSLSLARSEGVYIHVADSTSTFSQTVTGKGDYLSASRLRLAALEPPARGPDYNTLQDFFWTLFSKLDAVVQSLRVTYEIANRIGAVSVLSFGFESH